MKSTLIILCSIAFMAVNNNKNTSTCNFSISITNIDQSLARINRYLITSDSIIITSLGSLENEKDTEVERRRLTIVEEKKIKEFLNQFPFEMLLSEYQNKLVQDGDKKLIEISYRNHSKKIIIDNYYQEDIAALIKLINSLLRSSLQIKYEK